MVEAVKADHGTPCGEKLPRYMKSDEAGGSSEQYRITLHRLVLPKRRPTSVSTCGRALP
jgi:hypothetical protein